MALYIYIIFVVSYEYNSNSPGQSEPTRRRGEADGGDQRHHGHLLQGAEHRAL